MNVKLDKINSNMEKIACNMEKMACTLEVICKTLTELTEHSKKEAPLKIEKKLANQTEK